jgi:hypothetical protein
MFAIGPKPTSVANVVSFSIGRGLGSPQISGDLNFQSTALTLYDAVF